MATVVILFPPREVLRSQAPKTSIGRSHEMIGIGHRNVMEDPFVQSEREPGLFRPLAAHVRQRQRSPSVYCARSPVRNFFALQNRSQRSLRQVVMSAHAQLAYSRIALRYSRYLFARCAHPARSTTGISLHADNTKRITTTSSRLWRENVE